MPTSQLRQALAVIKENVHTRVRVCPPASMSTWPIGPKNAHGWRAGALFRRRSKQFVLATVQSVTKKRLKSLLNVAGKAYWNVAGTVILAILHVGGGHPGQPFGPARRSGDPSLARKRSLAHLFGYVASGVGETWISFPKDPELFAIPRASVWKTKTQAKKFLAKMMAAEEEDKEDDADADEEGDESNDGDGDGGDEGDGPGAGLRATGANRDGGVREEVEGVEGKGWRSKGWGVKGWWEKGWRVKGWRVKGWWVKGWRVKGWWVKGWWSVKEMGGIVGRVTRVRGRPPGPRPRRTFR